MEITDLDKKMDLITDILTFSKLTISMKVNFDSTKPYQSRSKWATKLKRFNESEKLRHFAYRWANNTIKVISYPLDFSDDSCFSNKYKFFTKAFEFEFLYLGTIDNIKQSIKRLHKTVYDYCDNYDCNIEMKILF